MQPACIIRNSMEHIVPLPLMQHNLIHTTTDSICINAVTVCPLIKPRTICLHYKNRMNVSGCRLLLSSIFFLYIVISFFRQRTQVKLCFVLWKIENKSWNQKQKENGFKWNDTNNIVSQSIKHNQRMYKHRIKAEQTYICLWK